MAYTHDIIIIGAGSAGLTAAAGCAQLGMKTLLIEKDKMGGDCLHYGCVPSKTLLKIALVYHSAGNLKRFGLPEAEIGPVDMVEVNRRVQDVIDKIYPHDSPERFRGLGAQVEFGSPRFLSPYEIDLNGKKKSAKKIVIATGSSPRSLPIPGLEETGFITNLDMFSLPKLPGSVLTVGAGPIGIEMSQALSRLGAKVTILEIAPHVLPREDEDVAEVVTKRLENEGLDILCGINIKEFKKTSSGKAVVLTTRNSSEEKVIEAEEILFSVGRKGNIEGLDLDNAGIEPVKSYIPVDKKLRTRQKHIIAIGDINGTLQFTHVAGAEGSFAVKRLALHLPGTMSYQNVPWITYTDPEIASVGYNEERANAEGIAYSVLTQPLESNDRALAEGEPDGFAKIILDKKGRIIGTQIVGYHAGDLLLPSLYAVSGKWKLGGLMSAMFPYPTMGEVHRKAVSTYMFPKLFNDKVRGFLRFLFKYRGEKYHSS